MRQDVDFMASQVQICQERGGSSPKSLRPNLRSSCDWASPEVLRCKYGIFWALVIHSTQSLCGVGGAETPQTTGPKGEGCLFIKSSSVSALE